MDVATFCCEGGDLTKEELHCIMLNLYHYCLFVERQYWNPRNRSSPKHINPDIWLIDSTNFGFYTINTGSTPEGLFSIHEDVSTCSDVDVMLELNKRLPGKITFCNDPSNEKQPALIAVEEDTSYLGYVKLRVRSTIEEKKFQDICHGWRLQNNYLHRECLWDELKLFLTIKTAPLGPANNVTIQSDEFDRVPCLHIKEWPPHASEWITRPRPNGWPSAEQVSEVCKMGCHVVTASHPESKCPETDFRLSFSVAERYLARSMTQVQRLTYSVFKTAVKEGPDMDIKSYCLKNLFFWAVERTKTVEWQPWNILDNVLLLFQCLKLAVMSGKIPHYFLPDNNLLTLISPESLDLVVSRCDYTMRADALYCFSRSHKPGPGYTGHVFFKYFKVIAFNVIANMQTCTQATAMPRKVFLSIFKQMLFELTLLNQSALSPGKDDNLLSICVDLCLADLDQDNAILQSGNIHTRKALIVQVIIMCQLTRCFIRVKCEAQAISTEDKLDLLLSPIRQYRECLRLLHKATDEIIHWFTAMSVACLSNITDIFEKEKPDMISPPHERDFSHEDHPHSYREQEWLWLVTVTGSYKI